MSREFPTYRLHLERLNERFPNKDMLTRKDLVAHTGICLSAVRNHFPYRGDYITKVDFARRLAMMDSA